MIKERVLKGVADTTRKIASKASSSASIVYIYQPETPEKLKKKD